MKITRRGLIRSSATLGGVATAGSVPEIASARSTSPVRRAVTATRTTLARVLVRGTPGPGGYRTIVEGPGEPHLLRTDLGATPQPGRETRRKPVIAFAQLSDVHIVDAQSPLRVEFSDRLEDPGPLPIDTGLLTSAYRPHEMLSGHIADAMVRELNAVATGPVTGKPLSLAIQTGDNSDNSQHNEVRWNIDLLDGQEVRIDSGSRSKYEGVADDSASYYDPSYWHPHGTPRGKADDIPRRERGFPTVPGLLDAARRPFRAAGMNIPWYAAFGNHDGLSQGNFPQTLQLSIVATGALKIVSTPAGVSPNALLKALQGGNLPALLASLALTPAVRFVTPDSARRLLTRKQIVEEHFSTAGLPVGHGFTADNRRDGTAYYFFDKGLTRFVVLDSVNPNGYADGSLDQAQFTWLQQVLADSAGRLVMVFSHHTSDTMTNPLVATGGDLQPRVLGAAVLDELLAHDEVIAWVNGHTHKNQVWARQGPDGGGLWEINTASHIDWPQQSRIIEVTDNRDGTLSLFTTIVDHAGPAASSGTGDSVQLAGLGRELAANDWQTGDDTYRGVPEARNVELAVRAPAFLA